MMVTVKENMAPEQAARSSRAQTLAATVREADGVE